LFNVARIENVFFKNDLQCKSEDANKYGLTFKLTEKGKFRLTLETGKRHSNEQTFVQ